MSTGLIAILVIVVASVACAVALRTRAPRRERRTQLSAVGDNAPRQLERSSHRTFVLEAPDSRSHLVGEIIPKDSSLLLQEGGSGSPSLGRMPKAWNQAVQTLPNVATALKKGELVRIIGPDHLVEGLAKGDMAHTITKSGVIGVVKGPDGKFVGHLRFESAGNPATVAGPLAVFQIASAVTMQYYLHQMTTRLVSIEQGIDDIKATLSAQTGAKISTGARTCTKFEPFIEGEVELEAADQREIAHAAQAASEAYETLKEQLNRFRVKVSEAVDADGTVRDPEKFDHALDVGTKSASRDAALFLEALDVRMRLLRLKAFAEIDADPARAELIRRSMEAEIDAMRHDFMALREPFDLLNVRRGELRRWGRIRGEDELESFRNASKGVRAIARTPVRRVLPEPPPPQPFVVELVQGDDGKIDSRCALLEPEPSDPSA